MKLYKAVLVLGFCFCFSSAVTAQGKQKALLRAVYKGDAQKVQDLLRQGAAVNDTTTSAVGLSPLAVAALTGDVPMAKLLVSHGADPSAAGYGAIESAVAFGHPEMLGYLLRSVNPALVPWARITPYHKLALEAPESMNVLMLYDILEEEDIPDDWMQEEEDDTDPFYSKWLTYSSTPFTQSVDTLIRYGAPINLMEEGGTALDEALEMEKPNMVMVLKLLEHGFYSAKGGANAEVFVLASRLNNINFLEKEPKELVNTPDRKGNLPLHQALFFGHDSLAAQLMQWGANPALEDSMGWTAAHAAAAGNCFSFLRTFRPALEPFTLKKSKDSLTAYEEAFVHDRKEATLYIINMHLDSVTLSGQVFPALQELAARENRTFTLSANQFALLDLLIQRRLFAAREEDYLPVLQSYIRMNAEPPHKTAFLRLAAFLNHPDLNQAIMEKWYAWLTPEERQLMLRLNIHKEDMLFFVAAQQDAHLLLDLPAFEQLGWDHTDKYGRTLLSVAAVQGNWKMVRGLLQKGASVNKYTADNRSVLYYAMVAAPEEEVQYLIQKGALLSSSEIEQIKTGNALSERNLAMAQQIFVINMLKEEVTHFNPKEPVDVHKPVTARRKSLVAYANSLKEQPVNFTVEIDQNPRFVMLFPHSRTGHFSSCSQVFGCLEHNMEEVRYFTYPGSTRKDYHLDVTIPDFGHLPYLDYRRNNGGVLFPRELETFLRVSVQIPPAEFKEDHPTSYPEVIIRNDSYGIPAPLNVKYDSETTSTTIYPGKEAQYDRSKGKIELFYQLSSKDYIRKSSFVSMNVGFQLPQPQGSSLEDRVALYKELHTAQRKITSDMPYSEKQKWMTYRHLLSETAIQHNFHTAVSGELRAALSELNTIEDGLKALYKVLYRGSGQEIDKPALIKALTALKNQFSDEAFRNEFQQFITSLGERFGSRLQEQISEFLDHQVFLRIHRSVIRVQMLLCELSQYTTRSQLEAYLKQASITLPSKNKLWVKANTLLKKEYVGGKGASLLHYLMD